MDIIWALLYLILAIFAVLLLVRIVFDVVQQFARHWRPKGVALVAASITYSITDPPLKWLRGKIPMRFGGMNLDLSFIVVFIVVAILKSIVLSLAIG